MEEKGKEDLNAGRGMRMRIKMKRISGTGMRRMRKIEMWIRRRRWMRMSK